MSNQVPTSVASALAGAAVMGLALLAGCGQKGPLVLPAAAPTAANAASAASASTVPAAGPAAVPAPRPAPATPASGSR